MPNKVFFYQQMSNKWSESKKEEEKISFIRFVYDFWKVKNDVKNLVTH